MFTRCLIVLLPVLSFVFLFFSRSAWLCVAHRCLAVVVDALYFFVFISSFLYISPESLFSRISPFPKSVKQSIRRITYINIYIYINKYTEAFQGG